MFIAMYDENDCIVEIFENRKDCARYFNTTLGSIYSFFSNVKKVELKIKS